VNKLGEGRLRFKIPDDNEDTDIQIPGYEMTKDCRPCYEREKYGDGYSQDSVFGHQDRGQYQPKR
jgi:hypothetical protein